MPNYNVYMGQGITIPDLHGNMLLTGEGDPGDAVQSCSAVVLVNRKTWAAGLYHFPEGGINTDEHSQSVLRAMAAAVEPDEAYIGFGTVGIRNNDPDFGSRQTQLQNGDELRSFVLRLLPLGTRLSRLPARTGRITVTTTGGATVIGDQSPFDWVDLRDKAEGTHTGYTTYGHAM
jgi:hypothetical protein